jgi:hypothetical protein
MEALPRTVAGQAAVRRTGEAPAEPEAGLHQAGRREAAVVATEADADRTVGAVIRIASTVTVAGS